VIGAVCGYLALWSVYWAFKLTTGKEGMGYGDFKLLAALGAWLGWEMLPLTILLSSLLGAVVGIASDRDRQARAQRADSLRPLPGGRGLTGTVLGQATDARLPRVCCSCHPAGNSPSLASVPGTGKRHLGSRIIVDSFRVPACVFSRVCHADLRLSLRNLRVSQRITCKNSVTRP
jgi:hypothetical protein